FFLHGCPGHVTHADPVPTRRSSDLERDPERGISDPGRPDGRPVRADRGHRPSDSFWGDIGRFRASRPLPLRPVGITVAAATLRSDRKSTRLNSSHVKISYAVFCLKK